MLVLPNDIRKQVDKAIAQAEADAVAGPALTSLVRKDIDLDPSIEFNASFAERFPASACARSTSLTRAEVLAVGAALGASTDDDELTRFLYLVNAWGYGTTGYGLSRTAKVAGRSEFKKSAQEALAVLRDPDAELAPVAAYYYLNKRSCGHVAGWGPAFFTKFLMFADPANTGAASSDRLSAVVLDRLTASQMRRYLSVPASERRPRRNRGLGVFGTSGWTTVQYAYYLALLRELIDDQCFDTPMKVERALFWLANQERTK